MTNKFVVRAECPVCEKVGDVIIDVPYSHPRLESWITKKYEDRIPVSVLESGRYVIRNCKDCKMLYQGEILAGKLLFDLYEKWTCPETSQRLEKSYSDSNPLRHIRSVGFIPSLISAPSSQVRILDFGAGWGSWALIARAMGYSVYVNEISPTRKAHFKLLDLEVVDLDLENPGDYRDFFDFLHVEQVFEHLPDPARVLASLIECLKPGGGVYLGVPNAKRLNASLPSRPDLSEINDSDLKKISPFQHLNGFSPKSLRKLAQKYGLQHFRCRSKLFSTNRGIVIDFLAWLLQPYRRSITSLVFIKPK